MEDTKLNFSKMRGLIPVVIQDEKTNEILMLAFQNEKAYELTLKHGEVFFFSRTRDEIWKKGETSGNVLKVVEILSDCDDDSLLIRVEHDPELMACHTGKRSCFFRSIKHKA